MSPLIPTRRVEEFAAAVDGRATRRHVAVSGLDELVALVESVRRVDSPPMRVGFVAELRADLLAEAERVLVSTPTPVPVRNVERRRGRRLAVAASTFVVAGSGVGLVTSSAYALPGEMLYPVKRTTERINLFIHTDAVDDGRILLGNAKTRLDEVSALLEQGGDVDELVAATLNDFAVDATRGGDILLDSYQETAEPADLEILRGFAQESAAMIEGLPLLPPSSSQALSKAATVVTDLDGAAVAACPQCGDGDPVINLGPDVVLTAQEIDPGRLDQGSGQGDGDPPGQPSVPGSGDNGAGGGQGEASDVPSSDVAPTDAPPVSELPAVEPPSTEPLPTELPATELPQATSSPAEDTTDPSSPGSPTTTVEEPVEEPVEVPDETEEVPDGDTETPPSGDESSSDPTTDVPTDPTPDEVPTEEVPTEVAPTDVETPSLPLPEPTDG
ncbi:MAG: DUF5667 domain-containing protein [Actinomycetota bacterium]|nr:DUF5667 domain-containing protein [Actinomycetota bacterium]